LSPGTAVTAEGAIDGVKAEGLDAPIPWVVTVTGPAAIPAPDGTVAFSDVALRAVTVAATLSKKRTTEVLSKYAPEIATEEPDTAADGETPVTETTRKMVVPVTFNPAVDRLTSPVVAPDGTTAVTVVAFTNAVAAGVPLK